MSFTDAEKTDIRRFSGYPVFGNGPNANWGYRFMTAYGSLEYKINNLSTTEETIVRTIYLANLYTLETDIISTRTNLDTASASVWTHNKNEHSDREALFLSWKKKLCDYLGVPYGLGLKGSSPHMVA